MGYCRRCGEVVTGERCSRCLGTAAAPMVPFSKPSNDGSTQDNWAKTYAAGNKSPSPTRPGSVQSSIEALNRNSSGPPSQTRRFPRPAQPTGGPGPQPLSSRVSRYIASATSARSTSPLKQTNTGAVADPSSDIIPSLVNNTLSKVYGSILQPKETLATYSCGICSDPFPPDATIYPDPSQPNSPNARFLCRPCYEENGGSKGPCGSCSRAVLTLKAEGGYIEAAGNFWHKKCFNCAGCSKNIGDRPMVDLLGQPCCVDCFDTCLKRDTPKKPGSASTRSSSSPAKSPSKVEPRLSNVGGLSKAAQGSKTREESPTIEELEQRLGITRNREGSPALENLSQRLNTVGRDINHRLSVGRPSFPVDTKSRSSSPSAASPTRSPRDASPTPEAVEEMKARLLRGLGPSSASPSSVSPQLPRSRYSSSALSTSSRSDTGSAYGALPPTPDLLSDFSDTTTQSSFSEAPDSPPPYSIDSESTLPFVTQRKALSNRMSRPDLFSPLDNVIIEETNSQLNTPIKTPIKSYTTTPTHTPVQISPLRLRKKSASTPKKESKESPSTSSPSNCFKCGGKLFILGDGSTFVTLPSSDKEQCPETYHTKCFTCSICDGVFRGEKKGQASFVRHHGRPCHPECAPKERITIHRSPSTPALRTYVTNLKRDPEPQSPSPSARTRPNTQRPISSRFEQPPLATSVNNTRPQPRFGSHNVCPGCKQAVLPIGQKIGPQGTKWHGSCLICGGRHARPNSWYGPRKDDKSPTPGCGKKLDSAAKSDGQGGVWCRECMLLLGLGSSPQPSPVRTVLSPTYTGSGKMVPQFTGTTTLARHFTGAAGGEAALLRQMTGGGLNPTRSISPTKQLVSSNPRPRPKSVIGMRNTKSVDEGRGMFLVRQLTGASSSGGWS